MITTKFALLALAIQSAELGDDVVGVAASVGTAPPRTIPGAPSPAAANLIALLIALGISALTELSRSGDCVCLLDPVPARGAHALHNECARYKVPPLGNEFDHEDAVFCEEKKPSYDAVNNGLTTLWEVKTHNLENYRPGGNFNDFILFIESRKIARQTVEQATRARQCSKKFNVLFGDSRFYDEMNRRLNGSFVPGGAFFDEVHFNDYCITPYGVDESDP